MWGNWTEFSPCNKTCGYGYRHRIRECNNPITEYGGMECPGPNKDIRKGCNVDPCPGIYVYIFFRNSSHTLLHMLDLKPIFVISNLQ